MLGWSVLILFLIALAATACVLVLLQPDDYFSSHKRTLICPETGEKVQVGIDTERAWQTLLTGVEQLRLNSCTRWPDRQMCDEECLLQFDAKPEILDRTLRKFYADKTCARCHRILTDNDWQHGRLAMLDSDGRMVPGGRLPLHEFPRALVHYRPVCWPCHSAEREQRAKPEQLFKGDRRDHRDELLLD